MAVLVLLVVPVWVAMHMPRPRSVKAVLRSTAAKRGPTSTPTRTRRTRGKGERMAYIAAAATGCAAPWRSTTSTSSAAAASTTTGVTTSKGRLMPRRILLSVALGHLPAVCAGMRTVGQPRGTEKAVGT